MVLKAAQSVGIPTEDDRTEPTTKYVDQDQEQIDNFMPEYLLLINNYTDIQARIYQISNYT